MIFLLVFLLGIPDAEPAAISGYKTRVLTQIFEDGSLWRSIEIDLNPDIEEGFTFKKERLEKAGYTCRRVVTDSSLTLTAERVYEAAGDSAVYQDALGQLKLVRKDHDFIFQEKFSNRILMDEVALAMLAADTATAKVLLADTQFDFKVRVPGRMTKVNIGEFDRTTAWWRFDIEELFRHETFVMEAFFNIERQETIAYVGFFIGAILILIALLFILKYTFARRLLKPQNNT